MPATAETIIVGGGIIGLCTALQLARRSAGRVVVVEKGIGPGEGSTGASSAVCRAKYSIDQTVVLARDGIDAYRRWTDFLEITDPVARLHADGVVWLGDGEDARQTVEQARLTALGVAAELLDEAALVDRYPAVNPCRLAPDLTSATPHDCVGGGVHLLESENGYVDPVDALQDLIRAVRARGVEIIFGSEVVGVRTSGNQVRDVTLSSGDTIGCANLVNAAGPWCRRVFDFVGLLNPWPLVATRIQVVHIDRPDTVVGTIPICADPAGGIYFRGQNRGAQILVGSILEEDEQEAVADADDFDRTADDMFVAMKLHALQHRIRNLDTLRSIRGYSGLYTMNRTDLHPVVGATPIDGFFVANGFSGHGFKLAPAIGSLIAQAIAGPASSFDTAVDPSFLAFDRAPIRLANRSVLA